MGKVLPFARKIPTSKLTPEDVTNSEQVALASIEAKHATGLIKAAFSQEDLDNFIAELDAMEDPEDTTDA